MTFIRARKSIFFYDTWQVKRIKEIIEKCEENEAQECVRVAMSHLEGVEGKVKEVDMWPAIQTLLSQVTAQTEQQIIQDQVLYLPCIYSFCVWSFVLCCWVCYSYLSTCTCCHSGELSLTTNNSDHFTIVVIVDEQVILLYILVYYNSPQSLVISCCTIHLRILSIS